MKRNNGGGVSLNMKVKKGLSEKVNYNRRIRGRVVSLVKSGQKNIPERRHGTCEVPGALKVEISGRTLQLT